MIHLPSLQSQKFWVGEGEGSLFELGPQGVGGEKNLLPPKDIKFVLAQRFRAAECGLQQGFVVLVVEGDMSRGGIQSEGLESGGIAATWAVLTTPSMRLR